MLRMHQQPALRQESLAFGQHILQQCNWQSAASKIAQTLIKPAHATLPNVPPKIVPKRMPQPTAPNHPAPNQSIAGITQPTAPENNKIATM
jgi:hypothetical protein